MRGLEHEREFQQQTAELARWKQKAGELARELGIARDMLSAVADVAAVPLPGRDGWEAFDRACRTRLLAIRGAARLGCVGQMPAIMAAEIAALKGVAAAELGYEPSPAALPKPAVPVSPSAEGGGVLIPKFTPHPPGRVSTTAAAALRLCDCPERDGRIYHERETCTDPLVAKLDWFAPSPPATAAAVDELVAERRAELADFAAPIPACDKCGRPPIDHRNGECIYPAAAAVDEPEPACMCSDPDCPDAVHQEPAAAADYCGCCGGLASDPPKGEHGACCAELHDEPAAAPAVVDAAAFNEPLRCELCGRVVGMPTAPCQRCPDYAPGWTFARVGSTTL